MTHGHELRWGNDGGRATEQTGIKGRKKRDNCNSIINKIYFKKPFNQPKTNTSHNQVS